MERMLIARADRQIIMRIQNMYLSYGGLLQFLLAPVGAAQRANLLVHQTPGIVLIAQWCG